MAGINWDVSLMLLKIGAQGIGRRRKGHAPARRAAKAIRYAADNGARVINWSGFVSDPTPEALAELRAAIEYAGTKNVLLVVGAGNSGLDIDRAENFTYPGLLRPRQHPDRGHDRFQGRARPLPGRGARAGVELRSEGYRYRRPRADLHDLRRERPEHIPAGGGTSNAGPVVAGIAALTLSVNPKLAALAFKKILMDTATPLPALNGKVGCGGMVNAYRALLAAKPR